MMKEQLLSYLKQPAKLDRNSLEKIRPLCEQFPYFTTARLLLIRNLFLLQDEGYRREIEQAAPFVSDRRILYELVSPIMQNPEPADEVEINEEAADLSNREETIEEVTDLADKTEAGKETDLMPDKEETFAETGEETVETPDQVKIMEEADDRSGQGPWVGEEIELVENPDGEAVIAIPEDPDKVDIADMVPPTEVVSPMDDLTGELLTLDVESEEPPSVEVVVTNKQQDPVSPARDEQGLHSFMDWLYLLEGPPAADKPVTKSRAESPTSNKVLIDKFIETSPRITPRKDHVSNVDISADSVREHEGIFTDTLARVYIKQGLYSKAIFTYEKLILKYPEKSGYFAGQIQEIKKRINKQ
jgi:hypothetical protein